MTPILEVNQCKKSYKGVTALSIDHLSINQGAIYGLIGPNGAGKTTLMKIILGLVQKDQGSIRLFGQDLNPKNQKACNQKMGALIENPAYYDHLTGYENLEIICQLKAISKTEILPTLDQVGLGAASKKKVRAYSLGMKQRLGIAMALIGKPRLLLLDEPINGLDPYGIEEMRDLFQSIVKNTDTSILISSHILDEIEKISTHIGILSKGKVVYSGSLQSYRSLYPPFISMTTSNNQLAAKILGLPEKNICGEKLILGNRSKEEIGDLVPLLVNKLAIYRIEEEKQSLEQLFIKETRGDSYAKH